MSATYNWAYRPSVTNKYGFTVPAGADNVRPSGWCYVALFGNDNTGNGSRQYPYRTITKAYSVISTGSYIVLGAGVYRELAIFNTTLGSSQIIGDGDVIIDISYNGGLMTADNYTHALYNLKVLGIGNSNLITNNANTIVRDCIFNGALPSPQGYYNATSSVIQILNCLYINISNSIAGSSFNGNYQFLQCTFVNCRNLAINDNNMSFRSCIFYNANISSSSSTFINSIYNLFFQCNFKLNAISSGGALYPSVPSGYTYYSTISALQSDFFTLYGSVGFTGCTISDPLFNNFNIGDYSLSFSSPAKNLSYFGTYVGARSIAYPVKASTKEDTGSFDFSTNVNLTIADDSITLVDPTQNAEIKTKLIINEGGRQISKLPIYGFNADRNGQYIDSIADLSSGVKIAGDTLSVPASYLVETGAINYNAVIYQAGDRFTTVSGQTTFTTVVSGVVREILEAPERHTIMARFGNGGAPVSAGDALVVGYWYYVVTESITYETVTYTAEQSFKAIDTNAFSGIGTVIVALSTEAFQHYESGIQPTSNNTGDSSTGTIIRGNGDPAYVRGGYGIQEFPINAKFIQLYYIINVSNLKP